MEDIIKRNGRNKNIIIILVDAFRPKNLSLFSYGKETDKNLKEIAKDSILFKNHFSTSNSTAAALTSIFTGKYPNNHGIIHQLPYTKKEEIEKVEKVKFWLPSYLKDKGYKTIAIDWIGMWFKKGFDFYGEKEEKQKLRAGALFSSAKEMTELAISKIKQTRKPFFLFMHIWDTHFPFPNTKYKSEGSEEERDKTLEGIKSESQREYLKKRIAKTNLYSIQDMINKYDLAIENLDKEIGRIYEFLREQDLWKDTIFIVLGDHGENITEHGIYFSHSGLYEDSIHVPLIMHLPGIDSTDSKDNKEVNELVQNVDIVPTILDLLKLEIEDKFDGCSLLPLIKNDKSIRGKVFLFDGLCVDIKAVRNANRKLIIAKDNSCHLCKASHHSKVEEYDLEKDPEETKNIYSGESELMKFFN